MAVDVGQSHRARTILAACVVLPVITFIFVALRIWSRVFVLHCLGWDDYTAAIVLLLCIVYSILVGLSTDRNVVPANNSVYVKWINDADMVYITTLLGYKMSILILYLRLFAVNRTFRYLTWSAMFFVCGYLIANLLTQIFGCSPRSKYWNPDTPGRCINYTKAGLAYGSMNIISDLLIFILPLPIIWQLKLSTREKVGVSIIFMSGAITCAVAVVRYVYIVQENSANAQYFIWRFLPPETFQISTGGLTDTLSIMEINIGIVCSCMPALRPFFKRVMPSLSIQSLSRRTPRSRSRQKNPEHPEGGAVLEMGRYRSIVEEDTARAEQLRAVELTVEGGSSHNLATGHV